MRGGRHRRILVALAAFGLTGLAAGCSFESEIAVQLLARCAGHGEAVHEGGCHSAARARNDDTVPARSSGSTAPSQASTTLTIRPARPCWFSSTSSTCARGRCRAEPLTSSTALVPSSSSSRPTRRTFRQPRRTRPGCRLTLPVQAPAHVDRARVRKATAGRARDAVRPRGTAFTLDRQPYGRARVQPARGPRRSGKRRSTPPQVSCGRSKYLQPIRPLVTRMAGARALTVQPSANKTSVSIPHLFGGIVAYRQATRTLSCLR